MKVVDPVCKMTVEDKDAFTAECEGKTSYFCSEGCRERFLKEKACRIPRISYDLIIIGGGTAGLTAAVYAATLKMNAFLITKDLGGQAIDSTKIENYMGFDFITGLELTEKFQYQLIHSHYIDHLMSDVERIETADDGFNITTSELKTYSAKTLIIAIGLQPNTSQVSHLVELNDRGEIVIGPDCSTSCPGIFAAGDVTNAFGKRIVIASGEGAKAALAARQYILNNAKE